MDNADISSDRFDYETYQANTEKRQNIQKLYELASDHHRELQYAKAEKLYQSAVELAEQLSDLSLLIQGRFWLASAQRMQGKYKEALSTCTWLIRKVRDAGNNA